MPRVWHTLRLPLALGLLLTIGCGGAGGGMDASRHEHLFVAGGTLNLSPATEGTLTPMLIGFEVDPATGTLAHRADVSPPPGQGLGQVVVDPSGKFLVVSSSFGSLSVYRINADGGLTLNFSNARHGPVNISAFGPSWGSGLAAFDPSGRFLYLANSFPASITVYSFDSASGTVTLVQEPGLGEMDVAISGIVAHPTQEILYVINSRPTQQGFTISAFSIGTDGRLASVPDGASGSASSYSALAVHGTGHFIYAGVNRTIRGFALAPDGSVGAEIAGSPFRVPLLNVTQILVHPGGNIGFAIGNVLDTEGQQRPMVAVLRIDSNTGALTPRFDNRVAGAPGALDASGEFLYVASSSDPFSLRPVGLVGYSIDPNSGALTQVAGSNPVLPAPATSLVSVR